MTGRWRAAKVAALVLVGAGAVFAQPAPLPPDWEPVPELFAEPPRSTPLEVSRAAWGDLSAGQLLVQLHVTAPTQDRSLIKSSLIAQLAREGVVAVELQEIATDTLLRSDLSVRRGPFVGTAVLVARTESSVLTSAQLTACFYSSRQAEQAVARCGELMKDL